VAKLTVARKRVIGLDCNVTGKVRGMERTCKKNKKRVDHGKGSKRHGLVKLTYLMRTNMSVRTKNRYKYREKSTERNRKKGGSVYAGGRVHGNGGPVRA